MSESSTSGCGPKIPRWLSALLSSAGVVMMLCFWAGAAGQIRKGYNDFLGFYAGARLCGTHWLYDGGKVMEIQLSEAKTTASALRLTRLPFYALVLSPLGRLHYQAAYVVWILLNAAALAGFVAVSGETDRWALLAACCCSIPIAASFANGQDVPFLLLLVATGTGLVRKGKHVLAGLVLSLCAVKYHLFVFIPLILLAQGLRRVILGVAAGTVALVCLSFVAGGQSWPVDYWRILNDPSVHPDIAKMPNLNGLTTSLGLPLPALVALSLVVAAGCWTIGQRFDFRTAFAAGLLGSLLVSYHSYAADAAILVPALLIVAQQGPLQKHLAIGLLTPVPWFILLRGGLVANATRAALLLLFLLCAYHAIRDFANSRQTTSEHLAVRPGI